MIEVAMIFAAGRGERMRPLTDHTPKPLLPVAGKSLIEWQIEALARAGVRHIVINHAWLGEQIPAALGNGARFGVTLHYSAESTALETAGGIAQALPLLHEYSVSSVFLAVSGDVFTAYDYAQLHARAEYLAQQAEPHMHLVMVPNPPFHSAGDFVLAQGRLYAKDAHREDASAQAFTFGNIGLYDMRQFEDIAMGERIAMSPFYRASIANGHASGELFTGVWENVGTPEQLAQLNARQLNP